jgi:hypothetical protein
MYPPVVHYVACTSVHTPSRADAMILLILVLFLLTAALDAAVAIWAWRLLRGMP